MNVPGSGFVGVGLVRSRVEPASSFRVNTPEGEKPVLEVVTEGQYHREFVDDPARRELLRLDPVAPNSSNRAGDQ